LGAALGDALGWETETKRIRFRGGVAKALAEAGSIGHVDPARSDALQAPWPDVIVSVGRRMIPVARWIKAQTGARAIFVQIGRIEHPYRLFDLIVTTPQYGLPPAGNVMRLTLPLVWRDEAAIVQAKAAWTNLGANLGTNLGANRGADALADLPKPRIGMLVGGPSHPIAFETEDGVRLGQASLKRARDIGGSLMIATGPRSPKAAVDALEATLLRAKSTAYRLFRFSAEGVNPYPAILDSADEFVVTSDSVSMLADAGFTGRLVRIFELPVKPFPPLWLPRLPMDWLGRRRVARLNRGDPADRLDEFYDGRVREGRTIPRRFVPILYRSLLRQGYVTALGAPDNPRADLARVMMQEQADVIARIRDLVVRFRESS